MVSLTVNWAAVGPGIGSAGDYDRGRPAQPTAVVGDGKAPLIVPGVAESEGEKVTLIVQEPPIEHSMSYPAAEVAAAVAAMVKFSVPVAFLRERLRIAGRPRSGSTSGGGETPATGRACPGQADGLRAVGGVIAEIQRGARLPVALV